MMSIAVKPHISMVFATGKRWQRHGIVSAHRMTVRRARAMVPPGGVVLLSPGAPTGPEFRDFQVRGDLFRELAANI